MPEFVYHTEEAETPKNVGFASTITLQTLEGKRRDVEEELRNRSVDDLSTEGDYESEKLNLWVLEFIRSVNATSRRICNIVKPTKALV